MSAAGVPPPLSHGVAAPPVRRPATVFGRPRGWTRGWAIVLLVWLTAAGVLTAVRLDMGRLTALSSRERAAIAAVEDAPLVEAVPTRRALAEVARQPESVGEPVGARPRWYATDRPWDDAVEVVWALGDRLRLQWTVGDDGDVVPSDETEVFLRQVYDAVGPSIGTEPASPSP